MVVIVNGINVGDAFIIILQGINIVWKNKFMVIVFKRNVDYNIYQTEFHQDFKKDIKFDIKKYIKK